MRYPLKYTLLIWALPLSVATAATINVPGDQPTIQAGIDSAAVAAVGDTVLVAPGTYYENIIWPEVNGIKLISAGDSSNTVIDGGGISSVIYMNPSTATIDSTTEVRGFKITNGGNVSNGGGLFVSSASPVLTQLWVTGNMATSDGGGLYISGGSPTLTGVTVTGNTASHGGGEAYQQYNNDGRHYTIGDGEVVKGSINDLDNDKRHARIDHDHPAHRSSGRPLSKATDFYFISIISREKVLSSIDP